MNHAPIRTSTAARCAPRRLIARPIATLCAALVALVVVLVVGTFLVLAPAAGALTRDAIEGTNPTIAQKMLGYDRWVRAQGRPADVLILGSSRAVELNPAQIERRTGRKAYNAGISSAGAREALAMFSYADLRSPGTPPDVLLMLDLEAFDGRRPTVRVLDYQQRILDARAACGVPTQCRAAWQRAAFEIAADGAAREAGGRPWRETQDDAGHQVNGRLAQMERDGVDMVALRNRRIGIRSESYGPGEFDHLYPAPRTAIERLVALANARGVEPTIAITTMHPACIRTCGPRGWQARRAEVRALLQQLDERYALRWIDLSWPAAWFGTSASFYDEIHPRPTAAALIVARLQRFGAFAPDASDG